MSTGGVAPASDSAGFGGAAAGGLFGGVITSIGQLAGAELGEPSSASSGLIIPNFNPQLNPLFTGSQTDAGNLIGVRGQPGPTQYQQLVNQIMGLPIEEKLKRRALLGLGRLREESRAGATGIPTVDLSSRFGGLAKQLLGDRGLTARPEFHAPEVRGVLNRIGLSEDELFTLFRTSDERQAQDEAFFNEQNQTNQITQRNRAETAQIASQLLGDAGRFASTGTAQSPFQTNILNRLNRGIDEQEEQFLLRSQFGGFQPGAGLENFGRQRSDVNATALEQALAAAGGLTAGLGGGLEFAQQGAAQATGTGLGAAGIAASQAQAANQIRGQANLAAANARAQGVSGGIGGLGNSITNFSFANSPAFNPQ